MNTVASLFLTFASLPLKNLQLISPSVFLSTNDVHASDYLRFSGLSFIISVLLFHYLISCNQPLTIPFRQIAMLVLMLHLPDLFQ